MELWLDLVIPLEKILSDHKMDKKEQNSQIKDLLKKYEMTTETLKQYAKWTLHRYTRNVMLTTGQFELLLVCWDLDTKSPIHNHSGSECFMKSIEGTVIQELFQNPTPEQKLSTEPKQLEKLEVTFIYKGDVLHINDDVGIHRMSNPSSTQPAVTLHVYIPSYQQCEIFLNETTYTQSCVLTNSQNSQNS